MTKEEFRNLKPGDRFHLDATGQTFTVSDVTVIVRCGESRFDERFIQFNRIELITGPTLPPHVAEIWEWDRSPKGSNISVGWVWHENWQWPHFGANYLNVWRLIPKIRKEDEQK